MNNKLKISQIISLSSMLFAMFFGAGNLIFPAFMGYEAGKNSIYSFLGFIFTDIGLSILTIIAVSFFETTDNLLRKLGKRISIVLSICVYMLIGPLFALPRTGTVSFELGVLPFVSSKNQLIYSLIFTFIFFTLTYILSLNPTKIVDIIGKVLTPILLITIAIIFIKSLIKPIGSIGIPNEEYNELPFFSGLIEGYLTLDGLAALAFAIIVINAIKNFGIESKKGILKYSAICGFIASIPLILVYGALCYIGASSRDLGVLENGGRVLTEATYYLFGSNGTIIFGIAVIFACLTTSIGITTSFGDYFSETFPKYSYKKIIFYVCLFSFFISNFGLTILIKFTKPLLIIIYPIIVVLVIVSFFNKFFQGRKEVYLFSVSAAFFVSFFDGLKSAGINNFFISNIMSNIPLFNLGIGWILPAIIGFFVGLSPIGKFLLKLRKKL